MQLIFYQLFLSKAIDNFIIFLFLTSICYKYNFMMHFV